MFKEECKVFETVKSQSHLTNDDDDRRNRSVMLNL